jgi:hypothetical protein
MHVYDMIERTCFLSKVVQATKAVRVGLALRTAHCALRHS